MDLLDRLSTGWKAWIILFLITFTAAAPGVFSLPALDRDESRFAQASKQMLESGDYIRLRYQDELRNKKPAGIHWLQAGSTALFSSAEAKEIWSYRIPSWLGAALATVATFWCGIVLVGRRAAFVGAALFGSTLLLTSEAHISKTDGMLVFLTTLGIGALARLYMRGEPDKRLALLFWFAMGASFLIKGPVTLMVAGFAGLGAYVWTRAAGERDRDWWRVLAWWPGPVLFVALVLPWFIWIQLATDGQYVQGAVGKDLKDKFAGASEGHAGWPLYHLTHIPAWFFPATLLVVPAAVMAWRELRGKSEVGQRRGTDALLIAAALAGLVGLVAWVLPPARGQTILPVYPALLLLVFWWLGTRTAWTQRWLQTPDLDPPRAMRFLAAWSVLTLLFFELMPTRLSHYILPAYPAFGLLCGVAAVRMMDGARLPVSRFVSLGLFIIGGGVLLAASHPAVVALFMDEAAGDFRTVDPAVVRQAWAGDLVFPMGMWAAGTVLAGLAAVLFAIRRIGASVFVAMAATLLIGWHVRASFLPGQTWIQATETAKLALVQVCGLPGETCAGEIEPPALVTAVGYAEPSYVMTIGTQNVHPPETVVELPDAPTGYPAVFLLNLEEEGGRDALETLTRAAEAAGRDITRSEPVYALNYSNGEAVAFTALRID